MKLVIDCFKLVKGAGKSIGIYNLARHLVWELAKYNAAAKEEEKQEILVLGNGKNRGDFAVEGVSFLEIDKNPLNKLVCIKWELFDVSVLAKKLGADKVLFPRGYMSLLHRTKEYVIIHDMIPFFYHEHYRGYFNRLENFYIMRRLRASARHADRVITISEASKRDIIKYSHADGERITVIYNGYNPIHRDIYALDMDCGDYLVAMTSKLPHKNADGVLRAYEAYRRLCEHPLPLTVIGVEQTKAAEGVTFIKYIGNESELYTLIYNAKAFLFLSFIEGFGFPPIEAMQLETPVVCSNQSSLPEVVKDAAVLVDPSDAEEAARALIKVTTDRAYAKELVKKGLENAERFNWETTGGKYREALFDEI